ncbi:GATA transcription factor 1-like [Macadamia integrifolia]|uniref:GATA transcription factor 1-like n=1 Tax=Macadamia integrifolia TaxID=60698 RepID=UPI001C4ECD53|nr:GATA transcription factor 1-like [Macadamia integrifolia]
MVSFEAGFLVEELLDFSSDIGEEEEEEEDNKQSNINNFATNINSNKALSSSSTLALDSKPTNPTHQNHQPQREAQTVLNIFDPDDDHNHHSFPEFLEEELEWITNEDAFPAVETFDDIFPGKLSKGPNNHSPVSVLENSSSSSNSGIMTCCASLRVPVRARSKRQRRKRTGFSNVSGQHWWWWCEPKNKSNGGGATVAAANENIMGRKCWHCGAEKTPQWRAGPQGPKTLCNACGVRFKSGRLVPEYRPASSPSFSTDLHSNSHRKILEMRRQKQQEFLVKSVDIG